MMLPGDRLVPLRCLGYVKARHRRLTVVDPCFGGESWGVHNNSFENGLRAVIERVFTVELGGSTTVPPQPRKGIIWRHLGRFARRLIDDVGRIEPLSTEEFVDTYVGRKRRMYQDAVDSLADRPLKLSDVYCQCFIKDEKTNLTSKGDPAPRLIQPRSARFNVEIGTMLKPMEKPIFHGIARVFKGTTVCKGLNALQRGALLREKWLKFDSPVAIMLDAKRFDQHISLQMLEWEHSVLEQICSTPSNLRRLNRMRRRDRCFFRAHDGEFWFKKHGGRRSGDMDTALANCMTMCAMTWSFMQSLGIGKYEYANDGDDGVLFVEGSAASSVLEAFGPWFLELGFTMKLEGVTREFERIEFCQARPVLGSRGWTMVRNPQVCLHKDSLSVKNLFTASDVSEARNLLGWCGMSLAADMPIFCEYYKRMISSERVDAEFTTGMQYLSYGMDVPVGGPSDETRISFFKAFGIAPEAQYAVENSIRTTRVNIGAPVPTDVIIGDFIDLSLIASGENEQ